MSPSRPRRAGPVTSTVRPDTGPPPGRAAPVAVRANDPSWLPWLESVTGGVGDSRSLRSARGSQSSSSRTDPDSVTVPPDILGPGSSEEGVRRRPFGGWGRRHSRPPWELRVVTSSAGLGSASGGGARRPPASAPGTARVCVSRRPRPTPEDSVRVRDAGWGPQSFQFSPVPRSGLVHPGPHSDEYCPCRRFRPPASLLFQIGRRVPHRDSRCAGDVLLPGRGGRGLVCPLILLFPNHPTRGTRLTTPPRGRPVLT